MKLNRILFATIAGAMFFASCTEVKNEVTTSEYDPNKTPVTSLTYIEEGSSDTKAVFEIDATAAVKAGATSVTIFLAKSMDDDVLGNGAFFKNIAVESEEPFKVTLSSITGTDGEKISLAKGDLFIPMIRANYPPFIHSSWTKVFIPGSDRLALEVGYGLKPVVFGPSAGVSATATDEAITVTWRRVPYAEAYVLEYKKDSESEWKVIDGISADNNSYVIEGLDYETSYSYRVKAVKGSDVTDYTADVIKTDKTFKLRTKDQVIEFFATRAAEAGEKDEFKIMNDIDFEGASVSSAASYAGILDGQGFALKNFKASAPLFAELTGKVSNLVIDGEYAIDATTVADFGSVAAVCKEKGSIEKVINNSDIVVSGSEFTAALRIGGIVGAAEGKISGCENRGKVSIITESTVVGLGLGGIAGYLANEMKDCVNKGDVTLQGKSVAKKATVGAVSSVLPTIGGCVGLGGNVEKFSMSKCNNSGKVTYCFDEVVLTANLNRDQEGGIVGSPCGPVTDCINAGDIYITLLISSGNYEYNLCIGGIGGGDYYLTSDTKEPYCNTAYTGCENKGNIVVETNSAKANSTLGGIVGWPGQEKGHKVFTTNCKNTGNLTVKGAAKIRVGGIQGGTGNMDACTNEGKIVVEGAASSSVVGALCGFHSQGHAITNCVVKGSVESKVKLTAIGGLVGNIGNAKHSTGEGCKINCELKGTDDTAEIGLIVGYFNGNSSAITLGTDASRIKVAGEVNGTKVTAANFQDYLNGPKNYKATSHVLYAEYGE